MDVEPLHTQLFELPSGHPLSNGYEVVNCTACGFVFADANVTQSDYDRFYSEFSKYEDQKTGTASGEGLFDQARLKITALQIAEFLDDTTARILDVGCANGGLLRELKGLGYKNICGLDPSPIWVENTRALGLEAHPGSLFQPFPYGKFDCVVLSHTLEHVQDVHGAVHWISEVLSSGGKQVAYIEVPDATRYVDFLYAPFQDFNTEHINHFSKVSLKNAMGLAGFEDVESGVKIFTISSNMEYPAIFGFWKKSTNEMIKKMEPDTDSVIRVREYIRQSPAIGGCN